MIERIHKRLITRLSVGALFLSILIGGVVAWIELEEIDDYVVGLATRISQDFLDENAQHIEAKNKDAIKLAIDHLTQDHFAIVEIYDADKKTLAESHGALGEEVEDYQEQEEHGFPQSAEPEYSKFFLDSGTYIQVVVPYYDANNTLNGFFEGVYRVDAETMSFVKAQVISSVFLTVVVVMATAVLLYPIILMLSRELVAYSRSLLKSNIQVLELLGNAVAKRDSDTDVHNYRVTIYSIMLAETISLDDDDIRRLIKGAFLHDVGKIGISDNILLKPGQLSAEEFETMKTHVDHGVEIIAPIAWLDDAKDVVQYHHEKYDGSGYMSGLEGDNIPLNARIFAIADVFDALISKRPYKEPLNLEEAISIMVKGRGSHFDPNLLDVFQSNAANFLDWMTAHDHDAIKNSMHGRIRHYFNL